MRTVLLLIDLINHSFCHDESTNLKKKQNTLTKNVNALIDIARSKDWPIIWVREQYKADLSDMPRWRKEKLKKKGKEAKVPTEGSCEAEFLAELHRRPAEDETVVKKNYSAFFGTDLCEILKKSQKKNRVSGSLSEESIPRHVFTQRPWMPSN